MLSDRSVLIATLLTIWYKSISERLSVSESRASIVPTGRLSKASSVGANKVRFE